MLDAIAVAVILATTSGNEPTDPPQPETQEPGASSPARPEVDPVSEPPKKEDDDDPDKAFTVSGYIETFYQWSFNRPGNGLSNYRGYDTRHNSITLQNAVVDAGFRAKGVMARIALQVGHAPATIYSEEPVSPGAAGANDSDGQLWRFLQRASLGWQASRLLLLEAGIFPSTTGVESLAVKENWNWSRSTASVRLPNYHAGVRATWTLSPRVDLFTAVINGWNDIVDQNDEKSFIAGAHYKVKDKLTLSASYFGGVERSGGAPEGRAWRHGFETWAQVDATDWLSLAADSSAGFERTRFGVAWWASAAVYARAKLLEWLYVAARADSLWEDVASSALGESEPILLPTKRMTSGTATVDFRPVKGFSARLEYRHDGAQSPLFFRGETDVPNTRRQDTALLGLTAWF